MRNNPAYKKLRQLLTENNYTSGQLEKATAKQLRTLLGLPETSSNDFLSNMKLVAVEQLKAEENEKCITEFKTRTKDALTWLKSTYPDTKIEIDNTDISVTTTGAI